MEPRTMYTTRKWESPRYRDKESKRGINQARRRVCPRSPIWHENFDRAQHKMEWEAGLERLRQRKFAESVKLAVEQQRLRQLGFSPPPHPMRTAFDGKTFDKNRSTVLSRTTIFCPQFKNGKEDVAPWPEHSEMKYEGEDRISTDKLHRRFLGAPRVEGNMSVNWQQRTIILQYPFDDFYYPIPNAVEIMLRTHHVPALEVENKIGEHLIGKELMGLLDPLDQW